MSEKEKPKIAGLRSMKLETKAGLYFWCTCGRSEDQPYCDGSHFGTSFLPMPVQIDDLKIVKWCTCKMTKTPPYCDHTHRKLPGYEAKV
ncbi:MAG: CDGSH iron-sulfur domain-containing protein [Bacteroidales bacterium]|nr:CDGSH iron-sulfur domain-containing protein [Bacteroidales bacterium]